LIAKLQANPRTKRDTIDVFPLGMLHFQTIVLKLDGVTTNAQKEFFDASNGTCDIVNLVS